jgi:diguanylate cyclase (GGDEF)-like protein
MFSLKLNTKVSLIAVSAVIFTVSILGVYFDSFLKEAYLEDATKRIMDAETKIRRDIKAHEKQLVQSVNFIDDDKEFLASVELINNYQDKEDYNAILLDEEKKILTSKLLKQVKISFNSNIALYDKNEELIAFVNKEPKGYKLNFISYEDAQVTLYSKYEFEREYKKEVYKEGFENDFKHVAYYTQPELRLTTPISYHSKESDIYIKAHKSIFGEINGITLMHAEISYKLGEKYFQNLSKNLNMDIFVSKESPHAIYANPIMQAHKKSEKIFQDSESYSLPHSIRTQDRTLYLTISLKKSLLNSALTKNRLELFYFTIVLTLLSLAALYYLFHAILLQPLNRLMQNIFKIEQGDYRASEIIPSNDELQEISININNLAKAVQARESQLLESRKKLIYLSNHDELTSLLNRRFFRKNFDEALQYAKESKQKLALLFLDLDEFKHINDTLGHNVGDELLVEVAKRLLEHLEKVDNLARIGGDEFTIFLKDIQDEEAVKSALDALLKEFEKPFLCGEYAINITASVGVSLYPEHGDNYVTLSKNADLAMYKAKELGRNKAKIFSPEYAKHLEEKSLIINTLKSALQTKEEFTLFYQPKVSTQTQKVVALEALIRWNSSTLGFVRPDQFISLAEETHMIIELGEWILHKACQDFIELKQEGFKLQQISVNISPIQLQHSNLLNTVKEVIKKSKIEPHELELEVTESYTATNEIEAIKILGEFRAMGVDLAIDDFGTGYSSLSYLEKLPVSRLKIDKAFIDNLPHSKESVAVVNAIIVLAKTFNLSLTAEGVESSEQREFLQEAQCDEIQGYFYSKPLALSELKEYLTEHS